MGEGDAIAGLNGSVDLRALYANIIVSLGHSEASYAMSTVGVAGDSFTLHRRIVRRANGQLTLPDGTLAGADIDMASCVRNAVTLLGLPLDEALRMAGLYPATLMGLAEYGRIAPGSVAAFVHLDEALNARPIGAVPGGGVVGLEQDQERARFQMAP